MVEDVFAAISAVENEVKKNADETMKQGFGLNKNITEILLGESNFYKLKISPLALNWKLDRNYLTYDSMNTRILV